MLQTHREMRSSLELQAIADFKDSLLHKIIKMIFSENMNQSKLQYLLVEASESLGGSSQTTILASQLIQWFLDQLQSILEPEYVLYVAKKTLHHLSNSQLEDCGPLSCILHSLYFHNPTCRTQLRILFGEFLLEGAAGDCARHLLEILYLIIQGFQIPLKEAHISFCRTYLIPLLTSENVSDFFPQLQRCIYHFTLTTRVLNHQIVSTILQQCNNPLNKMYSDFLNFAMDLLPSLDEEEFNLIQVLLYQRMAMFIKSNSVPSSAEAALRPFEDNITCQRIVHNLMISSSLLLPALHNGMLVHSGSIAERCAVARQMLSLHC